MLRFFAPSLLLTCLAVPGLALALGLGDIHVQSGLHEPLIAQIDLVDATSEELAGISARIADDDMFRSHDLDRPSYVDSTTIKVGADKDGHPILTLRSRDSYTEPVVTFLVAVHSPHGEQVREYSLLLDPPDLPIAKGGPEVAMVSGRTDSATATAKVADTASATIAPDVANTTASASVALREPLRSSAVTKPTSRAAPSKRTAASEFAPSGGEYTVAPRDTLDRIVTAAGAHSRNDRHRMMIAIFRANPAAFRTNLNKLRSGVTLRLPSAAQLSAISAESANAEFASQMAGWHENAASTAISAKQTPAPTPARAPERKAQDSGSAALSEKVALLEKSLGDVRQNIKQTLAQTSALQTQEPLTHAGSQARTQALSAQPTRAQTPSPTATPTRAQIISPTQALALSATQSLPQLTADPSDATNADAMIPTASASVPAHPASNNSDRSLAPARKHETTESQAPAAPVSHRGKLVATLAAILGSLLVAGAWFYLRRQPDEDSRDELRGKLAAPLRRVSDFDQPVDFVAATMPPFKPRPILTPAHADSYVVDEGTPDARPADPGAAAIGESGWFKSPLGTDIQDLLGGSKDSGKDSGRDAGKDSSDAAANSTARSLTPESAIAPKHAELPTIPGEIAPTTVDKPSERVNVAKQSMQIASDSAPDKAPEIAHDADTAAATNVGANVSLEDPADELARYARETVLEKDSVVDDSTAVIEASVEDLLSESAVRMPAESLAISDTTAILAVDNEMSAEELERELAFFNAPEMTSEDTHVVMGSALSERKPFVERRKNPVDVLRQAIEREPNRNDLRLKLLELYYTAAEQNRRAFLEVTRQLAKNEDLSSTQEWSQIADMGRTIAPGEKMFVELTGKKEVA